MNEDCGGTGRGEFASSRASPPFHPHAPVRPQLDQPFPRGAQLREGNHVVSRQVGLAMLSPMSME